MTLFCIFILIPFIAAKPYGEGPSYRSSVMEGDKPILRMAAEPEVDSAEDSDEVVPLRTASDARMVKDLSVLIGWLVENFGYDLVPQGRRSKDDTLISPIDEPVNKQKASRDSKDKGKKPGKPVEKPIKRKKSKREQQTTPGQDTALRESPTSPPSEPTWLLDLKEFIKDLVTRVGQRDLDRHLKPVIYSLEKKHNMKITDIDVDKYGDVLISYKDNYLNKER